MQKFQNNIQDQFGNEITLPTITVKNVVGGALSTIFSDNGVTPLGNPFIAQDLSEFFFYAANNRYDIFITGPVTDSLLDVLLFDPADGGVDASTARTGNFLFDVDVSASDPEADSIKFNNAVPANITSCRIALVDIDGLSIADLTALSLVGSRMRVWDELDPTQLQEFVVRTVPALDVDHFEFTVDFIAGTASIPADDKRLRVQFELTSFLGAGITSNNQNSTLFWDEDKQWSGTDSVQVNPNMPEVGGRIRSPGSAVIDVSRAMVFHNVGNSIGGTLYAETEANQGFYLFADFNGSPRTWEFGYDSGLFNGILAFEDSPLGIVVFGAARYLQGEKSAAAADVAGFGQWWVRDDAPNTPMYTDDAGNDFELNAVSGLVGVNGAKAFGSANQAIATGSGLTAVALNSEAYDTDSIHDLVTNNSRLTVPTGIARIRLTGYVKWQPNGSSFRILKITKNGALGTIDDDQAGYEPDMFTSAANATVPDVGVFIDSGIIRAVATDFFELEVSQESGVSLNLLAGDYWFQMDLIEDAPPTPPGGAGPDLDTLSSIDTFSLAVDATDPQGIWVSPDGKNVFVVSDNPDEVMVHYTMLVAFDLTTISTKQSEKVTPARTFGIAGNADGTKVYLGTLLGDILEYTLSPAYDLLSAVLNHTYDFNADSGTLAVALHFNFDGTELLVGGNNSKVYRVALSTGFDLSTETYPNDTFDATAQVTFAYGVAWDTDGLKMYISDLTSGVIYQYTLSAAFDVSTAVYALKSLNPTVIQNTGIHLDTGAGTLYVVFNDSGTPQIEEFK